MYVPIVADAGVGTQDFTLLLSLTMPAGAICGVMSFCLHDATYPTRLLLLLPPDVLQDLSPKYASALLGITNTAGAIPGVLGVTSAGYLLDATGSWQWALFFPTAAFQILGAVFYSIFASSERQHWS